MSIIEITTPEGGLAVDRRPDGQLSIHVLNSDPASLKILGISLTAAQEELLLDALLSSKMNQLTAGRPD